MIQPKFLVSLKNLYCSLSWLNVNFGYIYKKVDEGSGSVVGKVRIRTLLCKNPCTVLPPARKCLKREITFPWSHAVRCKLSTHKRPWLRSVESRLSTMVVDISLMRTIVVGGSRESLVESWMIHTLLWVMRRAGVRASGKVTRLCQGPIVSSSRIAFSDRVWESWFEEVVGVKVVLPKASNVSRPVCF